MGSSNRVEAIAELSESEGVLTTAQAARMGIPRDTLHDALESGRLERVLRGAYRMVGSGASFTDELAAIWKLTAPAKFSHERMRVADWDGVVGGGSTASALLGIGDLQLSPYRLYAPRRVNTRNPSANFAKRTMARDEVTFESGLPVTRPERTVFDLVADDEDLSLVADVLGDALRKYPGCDFGKLQILLEGRYGQKRGREIFEDPMEDTGKDPMEDTGRDPMEDTGKDPMEDTGRDPMEDTGKDPMEDTGKGPMEDTGLLGKVAQA